MRILQRQVEEYDISKRSLYKHYNPLIGPILFNYETVLLILVFSTSFLVKYIIFRLQTFFATKTLSLEILSNILGRPLVFVEILRYHRIFLVRGFPATLPNALVFLFISSVVERSSYIFRNHPEYRVSTLLEPEGEGHGNRSGA